MLQIQHVFSVETLTEFVLIPVKIFTALKLHGEGHYKFGNMWLRTADSCCCQRSKSYVLLTDLTNNDYKETNFAYVEESGSHVGKLYCSFKITHSACKAVDCTFVTEVRQVGMSGSVGYVVRYMADSVRKELLSPSYG